MLYNLHYVWLLELKMHYIGLMPTKLLFNCWLWEELSLSPGVLKKICPIYDLSCTYQCFGLEWDQDQDRFILTLNKGVAMVVLDKEDYINKAWGLLTQSAYKELPKDPTNRIKAQLITKLRRIKKNSNLDEGTYKAMYPTVCVLPKFYGLPKIHKTGNPLRPIVSSKGSVTYGVSKVLSKVLTLLVGKSPTYKVQVTLLLRPKGLLYNRESACHHMMSLQSLH